MGSDGRFAAALAIRAAILTIAITGFVASLMRPGLAATRLLAAALVFAAMLWLWRHVSLANREMARFVEALHAGDSAIRFERPGSAGSFGALAAAFEGALARLRAERVANVNELGFLQALLDDVPVALLIVDDAGGVEQRNKAARRLFGHRDASRIADYEHHGATFARRLAAGDGSEETLVLTLDGRPRRAIIRTERISRLGSALRAVTVQPADGAFDMVEMAAQSDLVRVLTHEILNSLTPVTSLAATAAMLMEELGPDDLDALPDARDAVVTLARRAQGLTEFVQGYRAVAQPPRVQRRRFPARPWADELVRLFTAEWPQLRISRSVLPEDLIIDADPDLMTQVLINLLRNAAQATKGHRPDPHITLDIAVEGPGVAISVGDNGPGIPAAIRQDIFLPFFTTRRDGSGIGLNLARQIMVAHGGTIDIAPVDEGAMLVLRLP